MNSYCAVKGEVLMQSVKLKTVIETLKLKNLTPDVNIDECQVTIPDINRPALQLTGYFEHFEN